MKKTLYILILILFKGCIAFGQQSKEVQDYILIKGKWQKYGVPYVMPDTVKIVHQYYWKLGKIVAMQDLKKTYAGYFILNQPYAVKQDTLGIVHTLKTL